MNENKVIDVDARLQELRVRREKLQELFRLESEISKMEGKLLASEDVVQMAEIVTEIVCKSFGVRPSDVKSKCRTELCVGPRHVLFYILTNDCHGTSAEVGRLFKRDHGSVLNGVKSVTDRIETDPRFATKMGLLRDECRQALINIDGNGTK